MAVIPVADLQSHINFYNDEELLGRKIAAAEAYVAAMIGRPLVAFTTAEVADEVDPEVTNTVVTINEKADLVEAVRILAAELFANREQTLIGETVRELPALDALLANHRVWTF